ncbi:ead/Ea22-like family protein [Salmonella enterica]|uniref:ead/Ea22-like family protein n=1 Tax=Salmonella enterica TaxID=28901 RepID=UPI000A190E48|nr:ead/Ea22-like family protein [Salmonella enterica]EDF8061194.1 ead/Ea22-like family protein [Salmonella enterica subsp. enterica serovar Muenchen]EDF8135426.1 ead/Ea22-like family protein [Salmonella enterica subsp. enterica serovar Litchfield]EDS5863810.1 ead/Ea22-like family protein [Salmonella enterica subsp. enterica serovar Gaminara]EDT7926940.1 ead/Ea22-like family protein [Salmonella enterica subsp. enterica]EAM2978581.1 ead/Ea22-like family protein [Salmonella enterica]
MTIDKRALREVAEKATPGTWRRTSSLFNGITVTPFSLCGEEVTLAHTVEKRDAEFIAAANPATMLALLDENIQLQREKDATEAVALALRDDMRQAREQLEAAEKRNAEQREYYEGVIADGSKRIAELENSETQLINERDAAESALADMYQAATGERPEWSNMFGFVDAVDVVEERLATLEANQSQTTPTGIQLITEAIGAHGYIVGCLLQGRPDLALEESRKWVSAFGQAAEIVSAQDAAGIKVKGE